MPEIINSVKKLYNFSNLVWTKYRWEFFLICSIFIFIFAYFFSKQDSYKGLNYDLNYINKKSKRVPKKYEKRCRMIVENIFNKPFSSIRPNFLKNPKTGKNLELDMYNPELRLAFEYQGVQHRKYTPFFHKTYTDFVDQIDRDTYKVKVCKAHGIDLIHIPDTVKYDDLENYIIQQLKNINRIK